MVRFFFLGITIIITIAYDILSDPDKRRQYDQFGAGGSTNQQHGFDYNSFYGQGAHHTHNAHFGFKFDEFFSDDFFNDDFFKDDWNDPIFSSFFSTHHDTREATHRKH